MPLCSYFFFALSLLLHTSALFLCSLFESLSQATSSKRQPLPKLLGVNMSSGTAMRAALRCRRCLWASTLVSGQRPAIGSQRRVVLARTFAASRHKHKDGNEQMLLEWALAAGVLAAATAAGTTHAVSKTETSVPSATPSSFVPSNILDGTTTSTAAAATTTSTACEPRNRHSQPKNVMLHRMRSVRARGLNDKYKVDWKTVLGEGAYGSVHPARLAATGEKVRPRWHYRCLFHGRLFVQGGKQR